MLTVSFLHLRRALGKALRAQQQAVQGLADAKPEGAEEGAEEEEENESARSPLFYAHYNKGMLGIAAVSKWVPADHPEGHKECALDGACSRVACVCVCVCVCV